MNSSPGADARQHSSATARVPGVLAALAALAVIGTLAVLATACAPSGEAATSARRASDGGSPDSGRVLLSRYGCGTCHMIPGVEGARGLVGPPLDHMKERSFVAGVLPNTPENLMRFIERPLSIDSASAMPDLGVTSGESRHMIAYLYSISR